MPLRIMVTAVGSGIGLAVLKSLKESKLDCVVYGVDMNPWATGLYHCQKSFLVPPAVDPQYCESLRELCQEEAIDIVIPGSDPELPFLAEAAADFAAVETRVLVGSAASVKTCRDKLETYRFFAAKKFNTFAETCSLKAWNSTDRLNDFPLLIKPPGGSASQDVRIVFSEEELEQCLHYNKEYIVQKYFIPLSWKLKKSSLTREQLFENGQMLQRDQISAEVLLDCSGKPYAFMNCLTSLKQGEHITVAPYRSEEVEEAALKMAGALGEIGLIGPCNLDGFITEEGPRFFEVNPRFTGLSAVRTYFGFQEVEATIRLLHLKDNPDEVKGLLDFREDLYCSRYVTEYFFNKNSYKTMQEGCLTGPDGFSIYI